MRAPEKPLPLDEVIELWPTVRQSSLSKFDDCALSALFSMRYESGWSTHPQARGTIEHRVFAECLRYMQKMDSEGIPVGTALAILEEKLRQEDVRPEDRVRVPLRELPIMRMSVAKWAKDNAFTIRSMIDVERRLHAELVYEANGKTVHRRLTGQIDVLFARGGDEAEVIDFKGTWALPPEHHEDDENPGLAPGGYFQQRFYAWLIMKNYPAVRAVTLREFYQWRSQSRAARVTHHELDQIDEELSILVQQYDAALAAGAPPRLTIEALEHHGHWKPSPGKHCFNCAKRGLCPIDDDYKDGALRTLADAERAAAARQVARAVAKQLTEQCKGWVDTNGRPIPVKRAKGRLLLGYRPTKTGRFEEYTPNGNDLAVTETVDDPSLIAAMEASIADARRERDAA